MMEILTLIAAPTVTALIAPILLGWINKKLNARKERMKAELALPQKEFDTEKYNDQLAHDLREELRKENKDLKETNQVLLTQIKTGAGAQAEIESWKSQFYSLKKEKQVLEFELTLVKQEIEKLRRAHEVYIAVRDRAEGTLGDEDHSDG